VLLEILVYKETQELMESTGLLVMMVPQVLKDLLVLLVL